MRKTALFYAFRVRYFSNEELFLIWKKPPNHEIFRRKKSNPAYLTLIFIHEMLEIKYKT